MEEKKENSYGSLFLFGLVVVYFLYQWTVVNPRNELEAKQQEKRDAQTNLDWCLANETTNYQADWENSCRHFGVSDKGSNCTLPKYNADSVDQRYQKAKDECFKKYPQN